MSEASGNRRAKRSEKTLAAQRFVSRADAFCQTRCHPIVDSELIGPDSVHPDDRHTLIHPAKPVE